MSSRPILSSVRAKFTGPNSAHFTVAHSAFPSPNPAAPDPVADRVAYLSRLRAALAAVQADVNRELTVRMDEEQTYQPLVRSSAVDEGREAEEMYGEEPQGDDGD